MTPAPRARARGIGALLWLVQPLYLVCELIAFAVVAAPYSLLHNTMSELGAVTCGDLSAGGVRIPVCSPAHPFYNAATVIFGAALLVGAVLLIKVSASRLHRIACVLWAIAGASTLAVGLVPLDVDLGLHVLVAWPSFLCQPVALLLHAAMLLRGGRRWAWLLILLGGVTIVGTVAVFRSSDLS